MEIGVGLPTNLSGTSKKLVLDWAQRAEAHPKAIVQPPRVGNGQLLKFTARILSGSRLGVVCQRCT